jgi:hypothetical protein
MLLVNPGPVTLAERVRRASLQPDNCHPEGEFFASQEEAREPLPSIYGLDPKVWTTVLYNGLGHGRPQYALHSGSACLPSAGGLARLGIEPMLSPQESSVVLRSYGLPAGMSDVSSADLNRLLKCVARQLT